MIFYSRTLVLMAHALAMFLCVACFLIGYSVKPYMPEIEGYLMPVVHVDQIDRRAMYRDTLKVCYALPLTKLRVADPITYQFFVEVRQNQNWLEPTPVNAYLAEDDNRRSADTEFRTHPVGEHWMRHWCFELPATVSDAQVLRVSGYALHRAHPLWRTKTPLPAFTIEALTSS